MKRFLILPVLALTTLISLGCSVDSGAILASVPGGAYSEQSGKATNDGQYSLYHVTKFDNFGAPIDSQKLTTVTLRAGDPLGFDYVIPPGKQYSPDAQSDVVAFAGSFRQNLGPIHTIDEKYFWCNPNDWDGYWSGQPTRVMSNRFTFH